MTTKSAFFSCQATVRERESEGQRAVSHLGGLADELAHVVAGGHDQMHGLDVRGVGGLGVRTQQTLGMVLKLVLRVQDEVGRHEGVRIQMSADARAHRHEPQLVARALHALQRKVERRLAVVAAIQRHEPLLACSWPGKQAVRDTSASEISHGARENRHPPPSARLHGRALPCSMDDDDGRRPLGKKAFATALHRCPHSLGSEWPWALASRFGRPS